MRSSFHLFKVEFRRSSDLWHEMSYKPSGIMCLDLYRSLGPWCDESSNFWAETLCSFLKVNWRFGGKSRLHLLLTVALATFLALLTLWSWNKRQLLPPKCLLAFNILRGVITQKIEEFLTTGVRNSYPIKVCFYGSQFPVCPLNLVSTSNRNS
jgi:hypothetical protein